MYIILTFSFCGNTQTQHRKLYRPRLLSLKVSHSSFNILIYSSGLFLLRNSTVPSCEGSSPPGSSPFTRTAVSASVAPSLVLQGSLLRRCRRRRRRRKGGGGAVCTCSGCFKLCQFRSVPHHVFFGLLLPRKLVNQVVPHRVQSLLQFGLAALVLRPQSRLHAREVGLSEERLGGVGGVRLEGAPAECRRRRQRRRCGWLDTREGGCHSGRRVLLRLLLLDLVWLRRSRARRGRIPFGHFERRSHQRRYSRGGSSGGSGGRRKVEPRFDGLVPNFKLGLEAPRAHRVPPLLHRHLLQLDLHLALADFGKHAQKLGEHPLPRVEMHLKHHRQQHRQLLFRHGAKHKPPAVPHHHTPARGQAAAAVCPTAFRPSALRLRFRRRARLGHGTHHGLNVRAGHPPAARPPSASAATAIVTTNIWSCQCWHTATASSSASTTSTFVVDIAREAKGRRSK
mmetsp:Transcript_20959/g.37943  ORF Transcript_20959/g.37943 Transcript_20959/m.37943 type:complete len:453 (-) Transcript_20959:25-1383(-)